MGQDFDLRIVPHPRDMKITSLKQNQNLIEKRKTNSDMWPFLTMWWYLVLEGRMIWNHYGVLSITPSLTKTPLWWNKDRQKTDRKPVWRWTLAVYGITELWYYCQTDFWTFSFLSIPTTIGIAWVHCFMSTSPFLTANLCLPVAFHNFIEITKLYRLFSFTIQFYKKELKVRMIHELKGAVLVHGVRYSKH